MSINFLKQLPPELSIKILNDLLPEDAINIASAVNKELNNLSNNEVYWKNKLRAHFPDNYVYLCLSNNICMVSWKEKFQRVYEIEYANLEQDAKRLFSLVKECDLDSLREIDISLADLTVRDTSGVSLCNWIQRTASDALSSLFLSKIRYIYQNEDPYNEGREINGYPLIYWAILLKRPYCEIKKLPRLYKKIDMNTFGPIMRNSVHVAAEAGNLNVLQSIGDKYPESLVSEDSLGQTPLLWAASRGNSDCVRYLLSKTVDKIDSTTNTLNSKVNGMTALAWAYKGGYTEIAGQLIEAGASATIMLNNKIESLVHLAARDGNISVLRAIGDKYPELLVSEDSLGQTPLLWAASRGNSDCVRYLLSKTVDKIDLATNKPNSKDNGMTALAWAYKGGYTEIAGQLIEAGASATIMLNNKIESLVHLAARDGNISVLRAIGDKYPESLVSEDSLGQTPLLWAASRGNSDCIRYLLSKTVDKIDLATNKPNSKDNGMTALAWAYKGGYTEIAGQLIEAGASATIMLNNKIESLVHLAARDGNISVLRAIGDKYPESLVSEDSLGQTPLAIAINSRDRVMVGNLLQATSYTKKDLLELYKSKTEQREKEKGVLHKWCARFFSPNQCGTKKIELATRALKNLDDGCEDAFKNFTQDEMRAVNSGNLYNNVTYYFR